MKQKILGFIAFIILRILGMTFRYRLHFNNIEEEINFKSRYNHKSPDDSLKYLIAIFHQDELCIMNFFRNKNISVLISVSKDGEIMYTAGSLLGYKPVRGSSSKKAVSGLIAAIRKVRDGFTMAFAVDGPRGPIYKVKDGICAVAKKTNTPIYPVRAVASRQKIFEKSWNKAKFPLPFATIDLHFGPAKIYTTEELENIMIKLV